MDHLPLPSNPTLNLEIPYLCTEDFDGGPFATYGTRSGWTWSSVPGPMEFKRNGEAASPDQLASFLQTWLYFGLLSETLGGWSSDVQKKFTAEGQSGQKRLSTECLEQIVVDWSGLLTRPDTTQEDLEKALDRFRECLETIRVIIFRIHRGRNEHKDSEVYQLLVLMSLAMFLTVT